MEIFFYGVGVFCVFASIGANFYFFHLLKCVYASMLDISLEVVSIKDSIKNVRGNIHLQGAVIDNIKHDLNEFKLAHNTADNTLSAKLNDFVETINVLNNKLEDYHDDIKKKQESEVRKNNWDSVREAFTRVNPKIQLQERN